MLGTGRTISKFREAAISLCDIHPYIEREDDFHYLVKASFLMKRNWMSTTINGPSDICLKG